MSALPSPRGGQAADPMVRLLGDLGSWSLGEPIAAGDGEVMVQLKLEALDELLVTLGADGLRALIAVLRHATPVRDEQGRARLELPGYSGAWLREQVGLSERSAYRASAALQDAGLMTTASLPGVRGSQGKQRAVLTGLVGLPGGKDGLVETRRGRRPGSTISTNRRNGRRDGSAVSTDLRKGEPDPQVNTVSTEAQNGVSTPTSSSEVGRISSLPSTDDTADGLAPAAGPAEVSALCGQAPSWFALHQRLTEVEAGSPGTLEELLRPVMLTRSSECGLLARALQLPDGPAMAHRVAHWLSTVLLAHPADLGTTAGAAGAVQAQLERAGVVFPRKDAPSPPQMLARTAVATLAGLDGKVASWPGWLASAQRKPATSWSSTATPTAVQMVLDGLYTGTVGPAALSSSDLVTQGSTAAACETQPTTRGPDTTVELTDDEVAEHLPAAVRAAGPFYSDRGLSWVAAKPSLARALVDDYLGASARRESQT